MHNRYNRNFRNNIGLVDVTDKFGLTQSYNVHANCCASCGMWNNGVCCNRSSHCYNSPTAPMFTCPNRIGN